ncbi:MAG: DUF2478 domain-containing protein [Gammaproteobacteria bacterium]|nr:DUF2478 domain-containing protein [Gammaproteobacteria bacterium]
MTDGQPITAFAAAVYTPRTTDRLALQRFVDRLKQRGVRVGGILQQASLGARGEVTGLHAVDIDSGQRYPLTRPVRNEDECGLDVAALAETTGIIRRAVDDRVALLVVEKFGEQEQSGKGLNDEILHAIAAGIPLLIAVSEAALPIWQERSGELGSIIDFDAEAFDRWWWSVAAEAR